MKFEDYKDGALLSIEDAAHEKTVDEKIVFLLEKINALSDYYTTSSCYGRIVVAESSVDNKKREYQFLGKWHREVTFHDVDAAVNKYKRNILFFRLDPVILHVGCRSLDCASRLLKICQRTGLKRSGMYQVKPRIIVEIMGVDALSVPLGMDGRVMVGRKYLDFLISIANEKFRNNEKKIDEFAQRVSSL